MRVSANCQEEREGGKCTGADGLIVTIRRRQARRWRKELVNLEDGWMGDRY